MQYMLLIYEAEQDAGSRDVDPGAFIQEYKEFTDSIVRSGELRAGDALQDTGSATSVRVREGKTLVTDGPFAETREQLGGYYLVEADNLDRALEIASSIPSARFGTIEVRPVMVWES